MEEFRKIVRKILLEKQVAKGHLDNSKWHIIPFGKHKGKNFRQVPDEYLRWLTKTMLEKKQAGTNCCFITS